MAPTVGGRIGAATFNQHARYVIEWTTAQLGEEGAAFFAQVPLTLRGENLFFTHGDAARPDCTSRYSAFLPDYGKTA